MGHLAIYVKSFEIFGLYWEFVPSYQCGNIEQNKTKMKDRVDKMVDNILPKMIRPPEKEI